MQNAVFFGFWRRAALLFAAFAMVSAPAAAQIETVDPNDVFDAQEAPAAEQPATGETVPDTAPAEDGVPTDGLPEYDIPAETPTAGAEVGAEGTATDIPERDDSKTYQEDDLIGAAEGVFGKGAEGLAKLIEDILKKQGKPNGYIVGREAGGAFVVGLRYGSGTLYHKVEGEKPVYWTGPSLGFDVGGNAGSTFVLVYNLYDTEDLFKRFASAEGVAYLVGGFNASYLRRGDVVLIPIRVGAGLRLGANVGYMKMSKKRRWLPF